MCYNERTRFRHSPCEKERKREQRGGGGGYRKGGCRGGQAIISNSIRSNGSHVRLIIIESSKRGCLIEPSRALRGLGDAD